MEENCTKRYHRLDHRFFVAITIYYSFDQHAKGVEMMLDNHHMATWRACGRELATTRT
jgi:hypothetical protein